MQSRLPPSAATLNAATARFPQPKARQAPAFEGERQGLRPRNEHQLSHGRLSVSD